jgi:hypothetical protein
MAGLVDFGRDGCNWDHSIHRRATSSIANHQMA